MDKITLGGGSFWCHPEFQRNPGKERLCKWYSSMFSKAKLAGVAWELSDLYSSHFNSNDKLPPYFDGDYWVSEFERLSLIPPCPGKSESSSSRREKVAESVRLNSDSLLVITLQPRCHRCHDLISRNHGYWEGDVTTVKGKTAAGSKIVLCGTCWRHQNNRRTTKSSAQYRAPLSSNRDDEENEVFNICMNSRADFLRLCETNHLQFDTYRRAKYSTMMMHTHTF